MVVSLILSAPRAENQIVLPVGLKNPVSASSIFIDGSAAVPLFVLKFPETSRVDPGLIVPIPTLSFAKFPYIVFPILS